jgi:2-phosphosulfolactate phosphatase
MRADVVLLPRELAPVHLQGRAVVVFDVLRATTTMTAALAAGVREIRIFGSVPEVLEAAVQVAPGERPLLCGEVKCLPPPGFDLGNSPGAFSAASHFSRTLFMATTNGTRAIVAAQGAQMLLAGALVNASAVARELARAALDITLLCAGTGGEIAMEDVLGAGAVLDSLQKIAPVQIASDVARMALRLFQACRDQLRQTLITCTGGENVVAVGLEADVDFAARVDVFDVVGVVQAGPLRVVRT